MSNTDQTPKSISIDYQKIYAAAAAKKLSSYQIADRALVSQGTVSRLLLGKCSPSGPNLKSICNVLDLAIEDVFIERPIKKAA